MKMHKWKIQFNEGVLMNSYKNIMIMEKCRTMNYAKGIEPDENEPCPVCGRSSWDYLLRDRDGFFVGCDECLKKFYS